MTHDNASPHFELGHKVERISPFILICTECEWESNTEPKMTAEERREADEWDAEVIYG